MDTGGRLPGLRLLVLIFGLLFVRSSLLSAQTVAPTSEEVTEVSLLRQRVAELEAQNTTILKELAAIQHQLEQIASPASMPGAMKVASAVPMVPPAVSKAPSVVATPSPSQTTPDAQASPPPFLLAEGNRSEVSLYGFARLDAVFDDSHINNFEAPTAVLSEPTGARNESNFTMHPRLTRFGANYRINNPIASMGGATVLGKIEIDFFNGGSESRAIPRYRQAYLQLKWGPHSLLAGQTSDLISPLFPNVNPHTLMWNAGNLGDRRTQFRYRYGKSTGINVQAGFGLTGAVDALDADGNGIRDGEASTMPNYQGRIGYTTKNGKYRLGVWGHYAKEHTTARIGGKNNFNSYSYGGDYDLRLTPGVNVRGELWAGSNLSDFRGGVGQSLNTATGKEIDSRGGWIELGLRSGRLGLYTGYTVDDPKNGELASGGITLNRTWYIHPQFRVAPPIATGIEYYFWQTKYKGPNDGTDNRFDLYIQYGF